MGTIELTFSSVPGVLRLGWILGGTVFFHQLFQDTTN